MDARLVRDRIRRQSGDLRLRLDLPARLLWEDGAPAALAKSLEVDISPAVMKWVIEDGGLEISDVADRLGVPESAVRGWMRERRKISVAKLEKLSAYARRPLAVFLLARPPARQTPTDYRKLPSSKSKITRDAAFAIRLARYLQGAAGEMMRMRGQDTSPGVGPGVTTRHSPETAALRERGRLGLDAERAAALGDARRRFNALRDAVESLNVLVFQQGANLDEMRGLSLSDGRPCAILINSRDPPAARRFTLMHEYGHILLRKGGMCAGPGGAPPDARSVEPWCNRFAGFALMPRDEFCGEYERQKAAGADGDEITTLLSRKFATSRPAAAIHALDLGLGTQAMVNRALKHRDAPAQKGKGGPSPPVKCISERGRKFVSLVLESRRARTISSRDAAVYLGTDLTHTKALQERLS